LQQGNVNINYNWVDINKLSNYTYAYARGLKDKAAY